MAPTIPLHSDGGGFPDEGEHAASVDAWIARATENRSPEQLVPLFELALGVLWGSTVTTLGEVTVTAITCAA